MRSAAPTIIAEVVMLSAAEGGRSRAIAIAHDSRYMPHLVVDDRSHRTVRTDAEGVSTEHSMGVLFEPALSISDPTTGSGRYPLRLMYHPRVSYASLEAGTTFTVREGGRVVGHGVVIRSAPSGESAAEGGA